MKTILGLFLTVMALSLVAPVMATFPGGGPKYDKFIAPLVEPGDSVRYGQVTYNVNPDDQHDDKYEVEVEVEDASAIFQDETVTVTIDSETFSLYIDADGNGKDTFYVDAIPTSVTLDDGNDDELETGTFVLWVKVQGKKAC